MNTAFEFFIKDLNKIEEEFRTIKRKQEYTNWNLHKVKKRVIIDTQGNKHYYNLGVYYIREIKNGKEKRTYFTHYHHDYLKQARRNKYSIETKTFAIFLKNSHARRPKFLPKSTYQHWISQNSKKKVISSKLEDKIANSYNSSSNKLHKYDVKVEHKNILYVEIDDTYKTIQQNKRKKKLMCRMLTFNLFNSKTKKYECINNVQIYFDKEEKLTKYDEKNSIVSLIEKIQNDYYKPGMEICIKGDGAKNINETAKYFDYQVLDKFHLIHYVRNAFILKKFLNNAIVKQFKNEFEIKGVYRYFENIFENYSISDWDKLFPNFINWTKNNKLDYRFSEALLKLIKYINNQKELIFDVPKVINKSSHTESYINNYFKKYISKRGTSYKISTIIDLVSDNFDYKNGLLQIY